MPQTPTQRTLRSGSNSSNITLQDIKSLIESKTGEILNEFKKEVVELKEIISLLTKRVDNLDAKNAQLTMQCEFLTRKCQNSEVVNRQQFEDTCREIQERQRRSKYIVVTGIPEHTSGDVEERRANDTKAIARLAETLEIDKFTPGEVSRIGHINSSKPRLLRFKCQDLETRSLLLKKSRNLRNSSSFRNIYINPDLTKTQRLLNADLRAELKRRRRDGENVVVRNGRIIEPLEDSNFR